MRALALVLVLLSTPVAATEQFDLVCTAKKVTERYRIDLIRREWCAGECETVVPIARVTSTAITLVSKERQFPSDYSSLKQVDRVTGEWVDMSAGGGFQARSTKGKCDRAPFSGFPAAKF